MPNAIGIDLGTESTNAGVYLNGSIDIIINKENSYSTPSVVAFTKYGRLVGEPAVAQRHRNPENTIFCVKRLIGRKYTDPVVDIYRKNFPNVLQNHNGCIKIRVQYQSKQLLFTPAEITAMILRKVKESAEIYLGMQIDIAVITVPTYFDDSQRKGTIDAGKMAGFEKILLLNEPIAAALSYNLNQTSDGEKNILVIDIGMGKIDLSILTIKDDLNIEVKSTRGNTDLGGIELINTFSDFLLTEFEKEGNTNIRTHVRCINKLKNASEKAIERLCKDNETVVEILNFYDNKNFKKEITRREFEKLCEPFFDKIMKYLIHLLEESKIDKADIHDIVLIGGNTKIPKFQELVRDFFDNKEICSGIDPETAVAFGAAIQAAIMSGNADDRIKDILLIDVIPASIGIETSEGKIRTVIPRNTRIPCKITETFNTFYDNQSEVSINIFEGERPNSEDNTFLDYFQLTDLPKLPKGELEIEVTFEVNKEGVVTVSAIEKECLKSACKIIKRNKGRLTEEELKETLKKVEEFEKGEKEHESRAIFMNAVENFLFKFRENIKQLPVDKLSVLDKKKINDSCVEALQWLEINPRADEKEIEEKRKALLYFLKPYEDVIDISELDIEHKKNDG